MDRLRSSFNRLVRAKPVDLLVCVAGPRCSRGLTVISSLQIKNERYSRFALQPTDDGERHAEIKLCDDLAEAGDQPGGSPSFRPVLPHQNRRHLWCFVLGLLLFFIGRMIMRMKNVGCVQQARQTFLSRVVGPPGCVLGYVSQAKPQAALVSCEPGVSPTTGSPTTSPTAIPAADVPAEETELDWKDITQLLKEKLISEAFTKTLRYSGEHEHVC